MKLDKQKQRLSSPVTLRDDVTILDIDHYAPFLLNAVSNAWQRKTSTIYREQFNLGITDWRVLSMLNIEPQITANRICEVIHLDKAAVSRSLRCLSERELVTFETASPTDPRKRCWCLSSRGLQVHDALLGQALASESALVSDIDPHELETFYRVMRQMLANLSG
ncbi:MAG: winged helix-turn-helix transcriptional regulator [Thiothrix sp.]|nr:winged helix-turn-helix transcriptional regulator [Thiothrix sp.]HPE59983.1 MarR family winged helix-turn-helix transcriptional regulator [Thiolinea sp.]